MDFRLLSLCTLVCMILSAACTDRDPLDSATMAATGDPSGDPGGDPTGEPPTDPPSDPGTTTGDVPTPTTAVDTGDLPTTGGSTSADPTMTSGSTTGDAPVESGQYLLAVSTSVAPELPIQFIATNTVSGAPGQQVLHLELQPLALDQGKVTTPRTPVGEPLVFEAIPVTDGIFKFDLGVVMIAGAANPITGGDITAQLAMVGEFVDQDFFCGTVDGEVTAPLMTSLTGSTFAAVRVADPSDLPVEVTLDCSGDTVLDP
ncbi:hypothetical protein SAMN02745121_01885 [Nannocystis exedens]|uniref:Lipoprotein n=1 Tax=Nannocystis exedens TaxID=54 RepID=A0A1I1VQZ6_9BACT|nr:hypothetical protein [Nannocystis exedens]PCC72768.1 hypothetical protein NAEX_05853 [Nannocystis exedens]SFD85492.1 hypothetical protein SAMN02745121_01885 [Nannocystis exedens]